MRKIKNMNLDEARQAFSKFEAKHPRNDDFDMSGLLLAQCGEITNGADRETISTILYDIFNYGFMAGYKQSEADTKAKIDKRICGDMHRRLLELVYYLPLGYRAKIFYYFMIFSFHEGMIEALFPKRIAKAALATKAEYEAEKARENADCEERKKVVDEALKQYEQRKHALTEMEVC